MAGNHENQKGGGEFFRAWLKGLIAFSLSLSADPFETMLKSLLQYQSGLGGDMAESCLRKKLYENGVTKLLPSNFPVIQKFFVLAALMEMELVLKKVIKERQRKSFSRHIFIDSLLQGNLSDKQCVSLSFLLLPLVCTWAVYLLTTSKEVQQKLYKELDQVLGKGPVTPVKIEQLRCGSVFILSLSFLFFFDRFDPGRFSDEAAIKNFSLLGFSGSQECPELRFACTVATVLLSVIVRKLHLQPVEGQVIDTKYELVTSPKEEAWITISRRNKGEE
ncbi:PREDICTED: cytochrome P450 20A1 [Thamnophis sirtalis]|uniref:Cytochrome P450 20A1 n=1 Tax=Thamnophis sirtalis TaxID=35019 RepID=A0A6I9YZE6_9SAUR|nr:PREDICTED: cytochrome P450 20A1 [Thamnophis sirtalis]